MKYHDFHLRGYSVEDFGARIVLDLVCDHPDQKKEESRIEFCDVACYSFDHASGAIITDIEELDVATLAREEGQKLAFLARQHGLKYWKADISDYIATIQKEQLRGWRIDSAIGFAGFVIARTVEASA
jgi:hypothetical protein